MFTSPGQRHCGTDGGARGIKWSSQVIPVTNFKVTPITPYFFQEKTAWKAKCPIFKAAVAGFRGKVAFKNRTLGVPGGPFRPR